MRHVELDRRVGRLDQVRLAVGVASENQRLRRDGRVLRQKLAEHPPGHDALPPVLLEDVAPPRQPPSSGPQPQALVQPRLSDVFGRDVPQVNELNGSGTGHEADYRANGWLRQGKTRLTPWCPRKNLRRAEPGASTGR